jgi:hypothetical protein
MHCIPGMLLTALFTVTGLVGAFVLYVEVSSVVRRRRVERRWREERRRERRD